MFKGYGIGIWIILIGLGILDPSVSIESQISIYLIFALGFTPFALALYRIEENLKEIRERLDPKKEEKEEKEENQSKK